ncbi:MAG: cobalamin-dependent protein, partial [Myxococcaceae bacterium]
MRVLLVGPDLESNLSLRYLASSLRAAGHSPCIATFDSPEDIPSVLRQARDAELVGLSMCFQVRAPEFLALARALKAEQPGRPIVAGGHFASCASAELLERNPELDLIVIHEGEHALVELA